MLIPRFSIKILLIITAIAAAIALVMREAVRGQSWAIGLCATLAGVAVVFGVYMALWCVAWAWDRTFANRGVSAPTGSNPFASAGPPPQIVPPSEPQ